jgi:hypothetical protein
MASTFPLPDSIFTGANWNIVARVDRPREPRPSDPSLHHPLREFSGGLRSPTFAVGVRSSDARPNWVTGGWIHCYLPPIVGSTSEFVTTKIGWYRVPLSSLEIYQLPPANYPEFSILFRLTFPTWLPSAYAEIWQLLP